MKINNQDARPQAGEVMRLRLVMLAALAALCSSAFADCREVRGGRLKGLASPEIWQARIACRGSTMVWFQSVAGKEGTKFVLRVDDLLIIPEQETPQTLSLFAPMDVECRHRSDLPSLVFAAGEWSRGNGRGGRQAINRAWRMDPATRKVEELPARDVSCAVR